MTDNDTHLSRRSSLKLLTGLGATAALGSGTATADPHAVTTDAAGHSKWVLRFQNAFVAADDSDPSVSTLKQRAREIRQQAVGALDTADQYEVKNEFWLVNAVLVTAKTDPETARTDLAGLAGVEQVHPDFEIPGPEPVSQQGVFPQDHGTHQYGLPQIKAPAVWETFDTRGSDVSVAVLDTGIDPDHPDLTLTEDGWAEFDAEGNRVESEPNDPDGHGTHVSGTIAGGRASGLENEPHLGVAPDVELYNVKVLDNGGTFTQIIAGIEWAVEQDIDIINMSLGATGTFDEMIEPVQNAIAAGTIVVSSAGNSGAGSSGSPGNIYDAFGIGATDSRDDVADFSSGERIRTAEDWDANWLTDHWPLNYYVPDVVAPGVDVLSAYPDDRYQRLSGTSMSSPHVAGATALLLSADPELRGENDAIKQLFADTATHGDGPDALPDTRYGDGSIDALSTVTAATNGTTVEGTVTDSDDTPLPGVTVAASYGTDAETNADGEYSLLVGDGEWDLTADPFGYQPQTETIQTGDAAAITQDLDLVSGIDVSVDRGQPDVVGLGERFEIALTVANLDAITVTLPGETDLASESLTVTANGTEIPIGEEYEFPEPVTDELVLAVTVADDAATGTLALTHEFAGPGDTITVPTGPSEVMTDPDPGAIEVVSWDETEEVIMGETLVPSIAVENTGDKTITEPLQWWLFDPEGQNVFTAAVVTLQGGEEATAELPIEIPAAFVPPGETGQHGWIAGDQSVSTTAEFFGPAFVFGEVSAPDQIDRGDRLEIEVPYQNEGNLEGSSTVDLIFDGVFVDSAPLSAAVGGGGTATVSFDTGRVVRDNYDYVLTSTYDEVSGSVWVGPVQGPPVIVGDNPPQDLTGDGLFEDIDGDGELDVFDVQALYNNLDTAAVQDNAEFFNFSGDDPTEVTIFDVQALYVRVQEFD